MTELIRELEKRLGEGVEVKETIVTKNGVDFAGLRFDTGREVAPVFYPENYEGTVEEIADAILEDYTNLAIPKFPDILDKDYIKENVFIALQRPSDEDLVKFPFLDMEAYLRIKISGDKVSTTKIVKSALPLIGLSFAELMVYATKNTAKSIYKGSLDEITGTSGLPSAIVLSNDDKNFGAGVIAVPGILEQLAEKYDDNLCIIPSSIHEVIIIPAAIVPDFAELTEMVQEINASELRPEEILSDHAYFYDRESNKIAC